MSRLLLRFTALLAATACPSSLSAQEVGIVYISVGQGDPTLIPRPRQEGGNRVAILFDAGNICNPDGGERVAAVLAQRNIRSLDYVIVSHYDTDELHDLDVANLAHGPLMRVPS